MQREKRTLTVEDPAAIENGDGEAKDLLEELLDLVGLADTCGAVQLVQVILAKRQSRDQVGAVHQGQLDKAQTLLERQIQGARLGRKTLLCASNNNGNRAAWASVQDVFARLFGH